VVATIRSSIASISALPMERASSGMITKGVRVITATSAAGKNHTVLSALSSSSGISTPTRPHGGYREGMNEKGF
jgi:hypothetical protein